MLESPGLLVAAAAVAGAALILAWRRRIAAPPVALGLGAAGLILLTLASGALAWLGVERPRVVVMVDLSASTRTAEYRRGELLRTRIGELLGTTPYRIVYFAQENRTEIEAASLLRDLPGERTLFAPPGAAAVVLFSDGQFALPRAAPPTYAVIDPGLADARDAAVSDVELRGATAAVAVRATEGTRRTLTGAADRGPATSRPVRGSGSAWMELADGARSFSAALDRGDAWPENDGLSIRVPTPLASERWWVAAGPAPAGWRSLSPTDLPGDGAAWLAPSVVVLDNVPADRIAPAQQRLLEQYVRDLGGALVIVGGDRAFAAGDYVGTTLESLSPLSSTPPSPTTHWVVLVDASGSMSAGAGSATRWELEKRAARGVVAQLPPEDPLSAGSFSDGLRWWTTGRSVRQTPASRIPPGDVTPGGPTNLEPALKQLAAQLDPAMSSEVLLMTDADTQIDDPAALRALLIQKKARLHVLAIAPGKSADVLREMAQTTGGRFMEAIEPREWAGSIRKLARAAAPDRVMRSAAAVRFTGDAGAIAASTPAVWNRTWLKQSAERIAQANVDGQTLPMAGQWNVGEGRVIAAGFAATAAHAQALAELIAARPRDPRLRVRWTTLREVRVSIEATENGAWLNSLALTLETSAGPGAPAQSHAIEQTGPGTYEVSLPASRQLVLASVRQDGRVVDRRALPGRYAAEFDSVGVNESSLRELARRTGGAVVPPDRKEPLNFNLPRHPVPLAPWLAMGGAVLLGLALARWRWG